MKNILARTAIVSIFWLLWFSLTGLWGVDTILFLKILAGYVLSDVLASILLGEQ